MPRRSRSAAHHSKARTPVNRSSWACDSSTMTSRTADGRRRSHLVEQRLDGRIVHRARDLQHDDRRILSLVDGHQPVVPERQRADARRARPRQVNHEAQARADEHGPRQRQHQRARPAVMPSSRRLDGGGSPHPADGRLTHHRRGDRRTGLPPASPGECTRWPQSRTAGSARSAAPRPQPPCGCPGARTGGGPTASGWPRPGTPR